MQPSPVQTPPSSPRAPGLDLLRAVAIAVVMLYHLSSHGIDVPGPGQHGWMGVDLFFVLSGYLIGWPVLRDLAAGRMPDWAGFAVGRAWRILPAYLAVLALYLAAPAWREAEAMPPVWQFLTFTMNVLPEHVAQGAYSHAWSLCVEEHFYLLFPLVAWLLARRGRMPGVFATSAGAALLFGAGMLLRDWEWRHAIAPHLASGDAARAVDGYVGTIYSPTWTRLDGLLAGVLLAALRAFRPGWWTRVLSHGWVLLGAGLALLVAAAWVDPLGHGGTVLLFPLVALGCACLLLGALSPRTPLGRRALPGVRTLALLAFSLYLTHRQVYAWLDDVAGDLTANAPLAAFVLYNGVSLAVAALLYVAVERPGLRMRPGTPRRLPGALAR
ncbi:Peptidoglycan/LPS O-acetylase OafA/YrhL, contains acyltransferase and SGNH-hydrolase domains [Massilia sp. PDC64]|nr:acyltransferase [Massilia sp. PDC64]SDE37547.1 Peptidoglycan/LPS O-acetylase OafA/YrhL, contains acyltransferase and SGNH-hydrolase domains [Massilia sp. PDC64]